MYKTNKSGRMVTTWDYLYITRYNGWKDLAQQEDPETETRARRAGLTQDAGLELRQHMPAHHDTIAERVAVQAPEEPSRSAPSCETQEARCSAGPWPIRDPLAGGCGRHG